MYVHINNGILLSHKNNGILPFTKTLVDLMGIKLSEIQSDRERQIAYDFTYMWNLKNKTSR